MEKRYDREFKKLGKKIRSLRAELGMSQLDLELASGINRTEISRIENGQKNLELITLVKLAIGLEKEMIDLFN